MKIAVIGANGKEGSLIVKEAVARGLDVTSIVRAAKKSPTDKYLVRDVYDLKAEDVKDFDVLVDALGFFGPNVKEYVPATKHLIEILNGSETRLLVVGGAGSLYVDKDHKQKVYEQAGFPDAVKPLSEEMGKSLDELRDSNINWTFISPAATFEAKGEKTGEYVLAGEELTYDKDGKSVISYADFALAMVDEIVNAKHQKERISVRW
ncbi:NAD(P)-dependent oxidoreductase [Companilactobacillus halodurans]|uniref:NAD(P)-dependent oxidoreductase n=1 Tax=Companilactobacillus halodurans TaxID=2584183 RepID=A0A5P0ZWZ8_9LACO|nr:NAD(P)H-binding protein [Companilactobacillus halodurans]MQS75274.1 NAD(P)-dependent oxidoreductase [Companilactobacillus halodurans]MQS97623.1 NAD(P)-dependent oxidoreductase [Companilactobacillus halodurans]